MRTFRCESCDNAIPNPSLIWYETRENGTPKGLYAYLKCEGCGEQEFRHIPDGQRSEATSVGSIGWRK